MPQEMTVKLGSQGLFNWPSDSPSVMENTCGEALFKKSYILKLCATLI